VIVAITGGTGFLGKHLIARHCARGDQVRYLTRKQASEGIASGSAFVGNLTSSVEHLRKFVRGADVLYHCAAELHNEAEMQNTNVFGTANLIAAAGGEIGRWVQLSSTGVYGRKAFDDVYEDTAANPADAYEISKEASDKVLREAAQQQNFPCVMVRPSNVYGIDMPNRSLFQLISMIDRGLFFFIGRPGAVANYVHVENVVDALVLCATAKLSGNGRTYIVSDHRKLEELVHIVAAALGKAPPRLRLPESLVRAVSMVAGGIPGFPLSLSRVDALTNRTVYRTDRIMTELGYENRISMEAGIGKLVRYWKNRSTGA
jgi:nucleoside-diphosphate-sugar epimerase